MFKKITFFYLIELLKTVENTSNERSDASEGNKKNLSGSQSDFSELHGSAQPEIHSYTQAQKDLAQRFVVKLDFKSSFLLEITCMQFFFYQTFVLLLY